MAIHEFTLEINDPDELSPLIYPPKIPDYCPPAPVVVNPRKRAASESLDVPASGTKRAKVARQQRSRSDEGPEFTLYEDTSATGAWTPEADAEVFGMHFRFVQRTAAMYAAIWMLEAAIRITNELEPIIEAIDARNGNHEMRRRFDPVRAKYDARYWGIDLDCVVFGCDSEEDNHMSGCHFSFEDAQELSDLIRLLMRKSRKKDRESIRLPLLLDGIDCVKLVRGYLFSSGFGLDIDREESYYVDLFVLWYNILQECVQLKLMRPLSINRQALRNHWFKGFMQCMWAEAEFIKGLFDMEFVVARMRDMKPWKSTVRDLIGGFEVLGETKRRV